MAARLPKFDWNDIPMLVALAHSGSMRAAGRRLGVDTSTVSRRLAAAERALQTRLFIRDPQGYRPTDAGRIFLATAEQIEGRVQALVTATTEEAESVSGPVRITSVDAVLSDWLVPRLPGLLARYPDVEIKAIPDNNVLSFTRSEADLAIRVARPQEDAALKMRRIGSVAMAVYGVAALKVASRKRWGQLPWLAFNEDLADTAEMIWMARTVPSARTPLRCSSMDTLIRACEAGIGLALLPCFVAEQRALVRFSAGPELHRDLWLLSHRDAGNIRRFRVVADWIAATAREDAPRLSPGR